MLRSRKTKGEKPGERCCPSEARQHYGTAKRKNSLATGHEQRARGRKRDRGRRESPEKQSVIFLQRVKKS